jgi:hypothetical protein
MSTSNPSSLSSNPRQVYDATRLFLYIAGAIVLGVLIAGFWNYHLVDGFGKDVIAGATIGNTAELAGGYSSHGAAFGFLFAAVAGAAATFTACNCVVFALLPGLACSVEDKGASASPLSVAGWFVAGVLSICGLYGVIVGVLGPSGVEMLNSDAIRLTQAQTVFTSLGVLMLGWSLLELGLARRLTRRLSDTTRSFFARPTTKAGLLGLMVGLFAVGRPYPVFRQFLSYAAEAGSPFYGAGVMMVQGAGQIFLMILLFGLLVWLAGRRLGRWAQEKPYQSRLVSGLALLVGGTFFVYYWGLSLTFDIGFWGYRLGWYAGQVPT